MQVAQENLETIYRTMSFQVSRKVWIRTWWKRLMFNPRTLIGLGLWAVFAIGCLFLPDPLRYLAVVFVVFILQAPFSVYRLYAKSVDGEPQLTDQKTLEFNSSRLAYTGPDWKNEMAWTRFKGLSEDAEYFFLEYRRSSLVGIIPKSAFTLEQQQAFRNCAEMHFVTNSPSAFVQR